MTFGYPGAQPIFKGLCVDIPAGQRVGLVGASGSGKSSFVSLLLRLYDVQGGAIVIDGVPVPDMTLDALHEQISLIPQDPSLFHRTLLDNIRYGKPDATQDEVADAARRAHAHEFIAQMPEGYRSMIGERGVKLSGGQRQRIAIARMRGKTVIVVAHRLSTIAHLDRILVFDQGQIVEDGSHRELLARGGAYARLWARQSGGFLPDSTRDAASPHPLRDPAQKCSPLVLPVPQPDDEPPPASRVLP